MKRIVKSIFLLVLTGVFVASAQSPVNSVGSGCALEFDGTGNGNAVIIPDRDELSGGHSLTLEAWIIMYPSSAHYGITMKYYNSPDKDYGMFVDVNDMKLAFGYELGENNPPAIKGNSTLSHYQYYHVAITFEDATNEVKLYVNGVLDGSGFTVSEIPNTPASLKIGKMFSSFYNTTSSAYNAFNFNGQIDEVRIWNYARTQAEIQRDMCRKLTGTEPGLVGYWRFDECGGSIATDASGNGNNGTLY